MRASRPRSRRHFHSLCCGQIERSVLINAGRAAVQELGPLAGYQKDLGTSVTTQEEVASTVWPGLELHVHIFDMGAADDEHVNACIAQGFDALSSASGVGLAVRHHGAIPVEDEGFIGFV